jgi:hypothetical protein
MRTRPVITVVAALVALVGLVLLVQETRARTTFDAPAAAEKVFGAPPAEIFPEERLRNRRDRHLPEMQH